MNWKVFATAALSCLSVSPVFAQPVLNVVPGGVQGNNWVWDVSITPDLVLAGGSTPLALELGFRLTGAPLLSATNINPTAFDTPLPGIIIFGWETLTDLDPGPIVNNHPVGLQTNLSTGEIFVAYGTGNFNTPGAKPFLRILTDGPVNGWPSSSIEWLGVYAGGHGRIAQAISGPPFAGNYDIYAGTATQTVPEPATWSLVLIAALALVPAIRRARRCKP